MITADPHFNRAMLFFWDKQNDGQPLHVSEHDPGGATSWGVVFRFWSAWRHLHGEPYGYSDFSVMPKEGFLPYLYSQYWLACRCQDLGAVGIVVYDHAGTSGQGTAAKLLQKVLGVTADGAIGPRTMAAFTAMPPALLVSKLTDARIDYYQSLANARLFPGWVPRARRCRDFAMHDLPPPVVA